MKLIDILPIEIWAAIEREANEKFNLNASVFDADGRSITGQTRRSNRLCQTIVASPDGQTQICARSHQDIAARARRGGGPVVDQCDAGMVKIVVPIFFDGEFIGAFGGCGKSLEGEEVDCFYVSKVTDIPEHEVEALARDIPSMTERETQDVAHLLAAQVHAVLESVAD